MEINRKKLLETLDALTETLGKSDEQSTEELLEDIRDEGMDVDAAMVRLKNARLRIATEAKRSALDSAREKRLKLFERGHGFIGKFNDWTKEQILARIKELCGPEAGLAYRDLEAVERDEIISILEDLELAHRSDTEESDKSE